MAAGFNAVPVDVNNVPIAEVYPPGSTGNIVALQGSTNTTLDAKGNTSAPANFNLTQINSLAVQMAGSDAVTSANVLEIVQALYNGATVDMLRSSAAGDGLTVGVGAAGSYLYNGASEDRQRGNLDNISVINASGVTTTQTSADLTNYNHKGVIVVLDMTTVGTGSVTIAIKAKDPVSGKYVTLLTGAAVITISTNAYYVYPGVPETANVSTSKPVSRTWQIVVTANNANATTYKVGTMYIV